MADSLAIDEHRVLVLAPQGRDAGLTAGLLEQHGIAAEVCPDVEFFLADLERGAGAAVVAVEAFGPDEVGRVAAALDRQPPWSDFPFIVFTARNASTLQNLRALEAVSRLGNVTAIERPVHAATLVSAARAALRARHRQYQSRRALEQRESELRHRDRFLAMLGHELRNPLSAIRYASDALMRAGAVDARGQRPLGVIDRQIRHLAHLVDDLLDVARVTSGKIALQRQSVDLGLLLQTALEESAPAVPGTGPAWRLDPPPRAVNVKGDPVRLHQVFTNLLTNAFKYTPPAGQVTVTLRGDDEGSAVVQVADTGVGISQEVLPIIFEPFAQADRTLDRSQGGMGLGLTVVRALVELHGGRVEVDSAGPGQGSVFTVRLPVAPSDGALVRAPQPQPPPAATLRRPRHVLLIEDSEDIRESLQELLADLGHRVEVAVDGEQGVARALASRPEVALVDIGLPRIDGYEVARRVRGALGRDILLIALTGYGQPEDAVRARSAGFDHHLRKPMSIDEIDRLLGQLSGAGDEGGQQQGVGGDDEADEAGEDDAVLEDGAEDGRLVTHLVRGGC